MASLHVLPCHPGDFLLKLHRRFRHVRTWAAASGLAMIWQDCRGRTCAAVTNFAPGGIAQTVVYRGAAVNNWPAVMPWAFAASKAEGQE
jgi:hypothetical protein